MEFGSPPETTTTILGEPQVCEECQTASRLTNGLCLTCLLREALDEEATPSGKEDFREILARVESASGDWKIADHEILHQIARGGMGIVYQAKEPLSGRIVALKCILAYQGASDQEISRFRREAETAAALEHPNIVPIYRIGETADGFPYYTMKYASAGSLVQARRPLLEHPRYSAALMVKVARAVQFAHDHGVVHRDLKPGNILLDGRGEPLVSDFGLARSDTMTSNLTRSMSSFGTAGYIAPEQAQAPSANLTTAVDVYSLGAIFFELLTGRTPFLGDNVFAVMKQSSEQPAPKVRRLAPRVDRDLEIICARCLERDPADRYPSVGALADDLQNWLDDRPIVASAPGPWLRSRRWVRRNRTLAVAILSMALVVSGSAIWQLRAQRHETIMKESVLTARSVVVLPFLDMDAVSADPDTTQWVADSLRSQLDSLGPARVTVGVVPSWSAADEIRKAVQASKGRTILTGTVRDVDGHRRVSLRLLNPATDQALVRAVIERPAGPAEAPQSPQKWVLDIHQLLDSDSWSNLVAVDPGTTNEKASEAMKAGRNWMRSYALADLDRAISFFRTAIELVPNSAQAHAFLAYAATSRIHLKADFSYLEMGKAAALRAVELAPESVPAHRALASVYYQEGKFHEALEEQMRTIEVGGPGDRITTFVAQTLNILGRPNHALRWCVVGQKTQDRPGDLEPTMGDCWVLLGDDEKAFVAYKRATDLRPGSNAGLVGKAHLHLVRGEIEAARKIYQEGAPGNELGDMARTAAQTEFFSHNWEAAEELYRRLAQSDPDGGGSFYGAVTYQSALGRIRQELGQRESGNALLEATLNAETALFAREPSNPEMAYRVAALEASLNLIQPALQHLRQAIVSGWLDYRSLQKDPRFDSLRSHPEFDTLIDGVSAKVAELRSNLN